MDRSDSDDGSGSEDEEMDLVELGQESGEQFTPPHQVWILWR